MYLIAINFDIAVKEVSEPEDIAEQINKNIIAIILKDKISEENKNKETQEIETLFDDDDEKLEIHELFDNRIFNPKYYDLGNVGRYKLNNRFNLNISKFIHDLTIKDIIAIVDTLITLNCGGDKERIIDDIDHLMI